MLLIDMNDTSWDAYADPAWSHRPSLHEMQAKEALELAYHVAKHLERQTTRPILERYQRTLFLYRKDNGQPLTPRTQYSRLTPLRATSNG